MSEYFFPGRWLFFYRIEYQFVSFHSEIIVAISVHFPHSLSLSTYFRFIFVFFVSLSSREATRDDRRPPDSLEFLKDPMRTFRTLRERDALGANESACRSAVSYRPRRWERGSPWIALSLGAP